VILDPAVVTECATAAAARQTHRQMSKPACGGAQGLKGFNGLRRLGCSSAGHYRRQVGGALKAPPAD
jgi:hypothetical protein